MMKIKEKKEGEKQIINKNNQLKSIKEQKNNGKKDDEMASSLKFQIE